MKNHFLLSVFLSAIGLHPCPSLAQTSSGHRLWHRVTLTFDGPRTSEDAAPNPFRDYRLNVTFTHSSGAKYTVPGFYAADGDAAETSAKAGGKWRVHFTPDRTGAWSYTVSFRTGPDVAISLDPAAGKPLPPDGLKGSINVNPTDKRIPDFRARGALRYVGGHYLQFAGDKSYYLKGGADSPENFLAYADFDDTWDTDGRHNEGGNPESKPFIHQYAPHIKDWRPGDPTWKGGKGKGIIGALNYLSSKGMNSVYFLTYNIDGGDGKDVWMWTSPMVRDRYDVSKLDQWEIVFSHMTARGIMLHVVTQETENDRKLGGSPGLNPIRKLYYRELVARFAHHPAVVWNQGEENNTPDADRKEIARYIRALDAYAHPITVHTHNNKAPTFYDGLLGDPFFEAASIQGDMRNYYRDAVALRERSAKAGRKWVIFGDEQPSAEVGIMPDASDPDHNVSRAEALWGNLLGGGAGVEWYFGYSFPHMDLNCEDWRSRDRMWDLTRYALDLFQRHLPFNEMEPLPDRVFAKKGSVYVKQVIGGGSKLDLPPGRYTYAWFDPRTGSLSEPRASAGAPPSDPQKDWILLVRK
jgi:hypothetical protein